MNWLDIFFLIIIAWFAWRGLATGLIAGLARLAGLFLGLVVASSYSVPLAEYANKHWQLEDKLRKWLPFSAGSIPEPVAGLEHGHRLPGKLITPDFLGQHGFGGLENFGQFLVSGLLEVAAFLFIFLLVAQLTSWIGSLVAVASRWTFLGPADRVGGLVLGLVCGVVIVLVLAALLIPLQMLAFPLPGGHQESWLSRAIEQSALVPLLRQILVKLPIIFPGLPQGFVKIIK